MIFHLTDAGRDLLENSMVEGASVYGVRFTRAEFGNGPAQEAAGATALNNPILTGLFNSVEIEEGSIKMGTTVSNESLNVGFNLTEVGYFAGKKIGDADVTDVILFAIGNEPEGEAFRIPSKIEYVTSFDFEFDLFVSDIENINAILNENASYASAEDFNRHITDYGNPHKVNKAQVGLSDVPNRTTNNQTPTFTEANLLDLLNGTEEDGDTLAELFSKLAKGQHDFIDHKADTNNPHGITAKKIDAAEKGHTHDTKEVTSGVFPIERGGTGMSYGAKSIMEVDETGRSIGCWGYYQAPGGFLIQIGRLERQKGSTECTVNLARPYKDGRYIVVFPSESGSWNSLVKEEPDWYPPQQYSDHFVMKSNHIGSTHVATWVTFGFV